MKKMIIILTIIAALGLGSFKALSSGKVEMAMNHDYDELNISTLLEQEAFLRNQEEELKRAEESRAIRVEQEAIRVAEEARKAGEEEASARCDRANAPASTQQFQTTFNHDGQQVILTARIGFGELILGV